MFAINKDELESLGRSHVDSDDPRVRARALLDVIESRNESARVKQDRVYAISEGLHHFQKTLDAAQAIVSEELGAPLDVYMRRERTYCKVMMYTCGAAVMGADRVRTWVAALPTYKLAAVDSGEVLNSIERAWARRSTFTPMLKKFEALSESEFAAVICGEPWPLAESAPAAE